MRSRDTRADHLLCTSNKVKHMSVREVVKRTTSNCYCGLMVRSHDGLRLNIANSRRRTHTSRLTAFPLIALSRCYSAERPRNRLRAILGSASAHDLGYKYNDYEPTKHLRRRPGYHRTQLPLCLRNDCIQTVMSALAEGRTVAPSGRG